MAPLLFLLLGCYPTASFTVDGDVATMTGAIKGSTPQAVAELIDQHPDLRQIVLLDVPGSLDDVSNLEASRMVRDAGLDTHVPADGQISSGGVDFFCAGVTRTAEPGARFGVHAWGAGRVDGSEVPEDDPRHDEYLDYYEEMGVPAEFYWFTLSAAPAAEIYWMTEEEIEAYGLLTE